MSSRATTDVYPPWNAGYTWRIQQNLIDSTDGLQTAVLSLKSLVTEARAARTIPHRPSRDRLRRNARLRTHASVDPELWLLHERYAQDRARTDLDLLVDEYDPYTRSLAKQYFRSVEGNEDLLQVAFEALVVALTRFEPSRRLPFIGFAHPTITGALKHHYRDHGWAIRVPRRVHELATAVADATARLTADLGRAPSLGQLADFLGLDDSVVQEVMLATVARRVEALTDHGIEFAVDDDEFAHVEFKRALAECRHTLSADDLRLVDWYFSEECTQAEIAARLNCSQMQVSRELRRVVGHLRRLLA